MRDPNSTNTATGVGFAHARKPRSTQRGPHIGALNEHVKHHAYLNKSDGKRRDATNGQTEGGQGTRQDVDKIGDGMEGARVLRAATRSAATSHRRAASILYGCPKPLDRPRFGEACGPLGVAPARAAHTRAAAEIQGPHPTPRGGTQCPLETPPGGPSPEGMSRKRKRA